MKSDFAIKGQRDYLSGSIVLDFILDRMVKHPSNIDMVFFRKTVNNCEFLTEPPPEGALLIGRYKDDANLIHVVETPEPITKRVPYPEEEVVRACSFGDDDVTVPGSVPGFSFIEKLVAAYKHLLHTRFPDHKGKLIFVQLKIARIPEGDFSIAFERKLGSDFYQASVLESGSRIGKVFFGEWR